MTDDDRSRRMLEVAELLAELIAREGARSALIGAAALAVHGYPRATQDLDLATELDPSTQLTDLKRACEARGFSTNLALPDAEDPLGGVLTVWGPDFDPVQVVNFYNPFRSITTPASDALDAAVPLAGYTHLRIVRLEHLIALKLYAGGARSRSDAAALLEANPTFDQDELQRVCDRHGLGNELARLLDGA